MKPTNQPYRIAHLRNVLLSFARTQPCLPHGNGILPQRLEWRTFRADGKDRRCDCDIVALTRFLKNIFCHYTSVRRNHFFKSISETFKNVLRAPLKILGACKNSCLMSMLHSLYNMFNLYKSKIVVGRAGR